MTEDSSVDAEASVSGGGDNIELEAVSTSEYVSSSLDLAFLARLSQRQTLLLP